MVMLQTIRYICEGASTDVIAQALAAHGYTVEIPSQACASGTTAMVLAQGMATVLLLETPDQRGVEIECSGPARDVTAHLLESLPIPLEKDNGAVSS
jgi:hypothetical protein